MTNKMRRLGVITLAGTLAACGRPDFIERKEVDVCGVPYVEWRDNRTFRDGPYKGCNITFVDPARTPEFDGYYSVYCGGGDKRNLFNGSLKDAPTRIKWIAVNLPKDYAGQEGR